MAQIHLRKYGVQTTVNFQLFDIDGVDFKIDAAHASGDTTVMKDEGAEANTTNGFTDEGQGYAIVLTATEMQAERVVVYIVDQGTKAWLDTAVIIETYGNASAMHAFDLDTATQSVAVTSIGNDVITAASIATGAIDADAIAASAIGSSELADGAITAAKFGAGAITATVIATDAIDDDALAADAVTAIQSGLSTLTAAGVRTAVGLASANLDTQLDALPTAAENADAVWDEDATGHQTQGTFGQAIGDPVADADTIWALVNTNLNATVGSRATQTSVDTIDGIVDDILVDTATTLQAELDGIQADTEDIQARLPAALTGAGNIKADALALNGSTTAAARLALSAATIVSGSAVTGTLSTTQMSTNLTEATDDHYNGRIIIWTSGVLVDQATDITDYTGATKVLTYTAVTEAPSNGDTFVIV